MPHSRTRSLGITLALASALSCTAILAPKDDVQRCGTPLDCDDTGDNRYVPLCVFDEEATGIDSTKVDKICVASYKNISCADDVTMAMTEKLDECKTYGPCTAPGTLGCEPDVTGCLDGLAVNDYGVCDDMDANTPPKVGTSYITAPDDPTLELEGQDVRDQFCRSYFCDDEFVCNAGSCVKCDPDLTYGEGGCGEVWRNGALSPVYVSGYDEDACMDASVEAVTFGTCP